MFQTPFGRAATLITLFLVIGSALLSVPSMADTIVLSGTRAQLWLQRNGYIDPLGKPLNKLRVFMNRLPGSGPGPAGLQGLTARGLKDFRTHPNQPLIDPVIIVDKTPFQLVRAWKFSVDCTTITKKEFLHWKAKYSGTIEILRQTGNTFTGILRSDHMGNNIVNGRITPGPPNIPTRISFNRIFMRNNPPSGSARVRETQLWEGAIRGNTIQNGFVTDRLHARCINLKMW